MTTNGDYLASGDKSAKWLLDTLSCDMLSAYSTTIALWGQHRTLVDIMCSSNIRIYLSLKSALLADMLINTDIYYIPKIDTYYSFSAESTIIKFIAFTQNNDYEVLYVYLVNRNKDNFVFTYDNTDGSYSKFSEIIGNYFNGFDNTISTDQQPLTKLIIVVKKINNDQSYYSLVRFINTLNTDIAGKLDIAPYLSYNTCSDSQYLLLPPNTRSLF